MADKLYDLEFLNRISNNDEVFIKEMVQSYLESTEEYIQKAEKHLNDSNLEGLQYATHKFIPGVSFLGIKYFEHDLMVLEDECKKGIDLKDAEFLYYSCKKKIMELKEVFMNDFDVNSGS